MYANNDISEKDLVKMIDIEYYLLAFSPEELVNIFDTKEKYLNFLDTLVVISRVDSGFFLLDSRIIESIRKVVNSMRDDFTSGINLECINSTIIMCNQADHIDKEMKNFYINNYIVNQSNIRGIEISSVNQMLALIINDAIVYDAFTNNDWSKVKNTGFLLASLMYLITYLPGVFTDEKYRKIVIDKLDSVKKSAGIFNKALKEYVKLVNNRIDGINKKEE